PRIVPRTPLTRASVVLVFFMARSPPPPTASLFPYTTLFRSRRHRLPRDPRRVVRRPGSPGAGPGGRAERLPAAGLSARSGSPRRSEEHTSELQSSCNLVCRLLLA